MTEPIHPLSQHNYDRYFHPVFQAHAVKVLLGEHRLSDQKDEMLVTTLGSCIAACIRDPVAGVGGMNHFLLPEAPSGSPVNAAARYGGVAMERLINDILVYGGRRDRLEVKVFGGARMISAQGSAGQGSAGEHNVSFILSFIEREGLLLAGQDLGGTLARRVHYFPVSGKVMRRLLRPDRMPGTMDKELRYLADLRKQPEEGGIELFGDCE